MACSKRVTPALALVWGMALGVNVQTMLAQGVDPHKSGEGKAATPSLSAKMATPRST